VSAFPRTVSPFLGSCPASGGASSFPRASARLFFPPRDLASRNPQAERQANVYRMNCFSRTVSPFLHSCSASGGASSFPPASALLVPPRRPCGLQGGQGARCVRPTSATCTIGVHPYLVSFWLLRDFHRVYIPRSLGLRAIDQRAGCFTAPTNASADHNFWQLSLLDTLCLAPSRHPFLGGDPGVGVVFPRRPLRSSL
jgi:hypothetical protein